MKNLYNIFIAFGFLALNIMTFGYFVPSTVAYYRRNECGNVNSIFVLNFFLGWTLIGWVVALIWAMKDKPHHQIILVKDALDTHSSTGKRLRLTNEQINCLLAASNGEVLYGETPKFRSSQTPNGSHAFDLRTIDSLVKRGYLISDGCGGYIKTETTHQALKSSMGF